MKTPLSELKGVGPKTEKKLNRLGLYSVEDLIANFPRSYVNKGNITRIGDIKDGEFVTIKARISAIQTQMTKFKKSMLKLKVTDGFGYLQLIFFNAPYLQKKFNVGDEYYFFGQIKKEGLLPVLFHPEYFSMEQIDKNPDCLGISPIYGLTDGLTQSEMNQFHTEALYRFKSQVEESLPLWLLESYKLCGKTYAIEQIHRPKDKKSYQIAKYRLIFEELFELQAGLFALKRDVKNQKSYAHQGESKILEIIENLPFKLTTGQKKVVDEVLFAMGSDVMMNRLIQGDVGSGKTIVAFLAMHYAVQNGYQSALMVPTEILAEQHFRSFETLFKGSYRMALLTGSTKNKKAIKAQIANGEIDFIVGTHALLEEDLVFSKLSLVITDEQHRFGVGQRFNLATKGLNPHVIVMSATPIPRTLSLVLYGDVDISIIDQLPMGRKPIHTAYVPEKQMEKVHEAIESAIFRNEQVYVVCPLVEESETMDLNSAEQTYNTFSALYPHQSVGLIHGKMKSKEKDAVMKAFENKEIQILVATTVIEVGINVPSATVMIVMNTERFGLSQLHQLRGRVGRGGDQSYCYLVSNQPGKIAKERIKVMTESTDGFYIADKDLSLRGPGEFFGMRQHGLPQLKLADLSKHLDVLETAQKAVREVFERLETDLSSQNYIEGLKRSIMEKFAL